MPTIRTKLFGPGKEEAKRRPISPAVHKRLTNIFKEMLKKQPGDVKMFIGGKEFEKIFIDLKRVGPSSAIGLWLRTNPNGVKLEEKAVSILIGNEDAAADKKTMAALRRVGRKLAYPTKIYDDIESDTRPLIATLFLDRPSFDESIFAAAASSLAAAFFEPILFTKSPKS